MGSRALTVTQDAGQPPDEIGAEVAEGGLGERHLPEDVTQRGGAWGPGARPLRPRPWPGPRPRSRAASGAQLRTGGRTAQERGAAAKPGAGSGLGRRRHSRPGRPEPRRGTSAGVALRAKRASVPSGPRPSAPGFRLRPPPLRRRAVWGRGQGRGRPGVGPRAGLGPAGRGEAKGVGPAEWGGGWAGPACGAGTPRRSEPGGQKRQAGSRDPVPGTRPPDSDARCLHLR